MAMESTGTSILRRHSKCRKYTEAEFTRAVQLSVEEGLVINESVNLLDSHDSDEKTDRYFRNLRDSR